LSGWHRSCSKESQLQVARAKESRSLGSVASSWTLRQLERGPPWPGL